MIEVAANLMAERLRQLQFIETVCGIAVPQHFNDNGTAKVFPACPPLQGEENVWLVPESSKSAIAYFEAMSVRQTDILSGNRGGIYDAVLRCVVWLNNDRLVPKQAKSSAASAVVANLHGRYGDFPPISNLRVWVTGEPLQSPDVIFGKWDYNEAELQYLMPPYTFFAVDFLLSYVVQTFCPAPVITKQPCC